MLKMGIPLGAVEQALQKEGKDRSIASMDPNKPLAYQIKEKEEEVKKAEPVALKDDPEYSKFFNVCHIYCINCLFISITLNNYCLLQMLKMGVPLPAVKQALVKEGKDPSIIDMDPEKPFTKAVPLKEDPEYAKFFKVRWLIFYFWLTNSNTRELITCVSIFQDAQNGHSSTGCQASTSERR